MSRIQGVLKGKAIDEPLSSLSTPKFIKTSLSFKFNFSPLRGNQARDQTPRRSRRCISKVR